MASISKMCLNNITSGHWFQVNGRNGRATDGTRTEATELLRFWKPDGCIVNNDHLSARLFNGIPTIFLHRDPVKLPRNADWGAYDENAIAELAARELLPLGCASFVYVPAPAEEHWDSARRTAFIHALKINGQSCSVVRHPHTRSAVRIQASLGRALTALPRLPSPWAEGPRQMTCPLFYNHSPGHFPHASRRIGFISSYQIAYPLRFG